MDESNSLTGAAASSLHCHNPILMEVTLLDERLPIIMTISKFGCNCHSSVKFVILNFLYELQCCLPGVPDNMIQLTPASVS